MNIPPKHLEKLEELLSSYGLLPQNPNRQEILDRSEFKYGEVSRASDGTKFSFVYANFVLKFLLNPIDFEHLSSFIFTSKDRIHYFALKYDSQIHIEFEKKDSDLGKEISKYKEGGFILPQNDHWKVFGNSIAANKVLPDVFLPEGKDYTFVSFDEVKNFMDSSREAFSYPFRLFAQNKYYFVLKNDGSILKNLNDGPASKDPIIRLTRLGFKRGYEVMARQVLDQFVLTQKNVAKLPDIVPFEKDSLIVFSDLVKTSFPEFYGSYLDVSTYNFSIRWKENSYFLINENSDAFKKIKNMKSGSDSKDRDESRLVRVVQAFKSKFVDLDYSVRCMSSFISRHYMCEKWAVKSKRGAPFSYSCLLSHFQSSGSGKSRTSQLLSSVMDTIYMSSPTASGYPKECGIFREFRKWFSDCIFGREPIPVVVLMVVVLNFFNRLLYLCLVRRRELHLKWKENPSSFEDKQDPFFRFMAPGYLITKCDERFLYDNLKAFITETIETEASERTSGQDFCQEFTSFGDSWKINTKNPLVNETIYRIPFSEEIPSSHALAANFTFEGLKLLLETSRAERVENMAEKWPKDEREERKARFSSDLEGLPYAMIIFDEAQNLLASYTNYLTYTVKNYDGSILDLDFFRLIRRCFRISPFNWECVWGMVLSTNTNISNFVPTPMEDPSLRMWENTFLLPPFLMNCNFDVFAEKYYNSLYELRNPKEYLCQLQRILDIISCGRPLFHSSFHVNKDFKNTLASLADKPWIKHWGSLNASFRELYTFCLLKISCTTAAIDDIDKQISKNENLKFALVSASIGLLSIPSVVNKHELVKNNMAWLVAADIQKGELEITYPSEGFFNSVAARILEQSTGSTLAPVTKISSGVPKNIADNYVSVERKFVSKFTNIVTDDPNYLSFLENADSKSFFDTGEVGEIVCRFLFLLAIFRTKIVFPDDFERPRGDYLMFDNISSMFYPRLICDFLNQFVDRRITKMFLSLSDSFYRKATNSTAENVFSEAQTAFTYFHRCKRVSNPAEFTKGMLYRGCARITPLNHRGADFILPLVSGDDRLGNIMVQVKFKTKKYFNSAYREMDVEKQVNRMKSLLKAFDKMGDLNLASLNQVKSRHRNTVESFDVDISNFNLKTVFEPKKYPEDTSNLDFKEHMHPLSELECKEFPSLRIFLNLKSDAMATTSSIELDHFGPVLVIETNGKFPFLKPGNEESMTLNIINKARPRASVTELKGQYFSPGQPRTLSEKELPTNPIFYQDKVDDDETKIGLSYFAESREELEKIFKDRPKFLHDFDIAFPKDEEPLAKKSKKSQNF